MPIKRFFKILQANIHSGKTTSREKYSADRQEKPNQENVNNSRNSFKNESIKPKVSPTDLLEAEYYSNLEIPFGSDFEMIKSAYRKLMKKYHPDKFHGDEAKKKHAEAISIRLNEAYNYFEKKFPAKT